MAKQVHIKKAVKPHVKVKSSNSLFAERWYAAIIFIFSFLIYFNSVFNDYNLDDELVTQNHKLTSKGISAIPEIFASPYYSDAAGYKYEYRPVVLVSFAIEHSLFGENPHTSHFINVLLYALMCVLLYQVLKRLLTGYNLLLPLIITLVFAAHPIHTEVVASIKNRDEELALIFGLLSLGASIVFSNRMHLINNGEEPTKHLPALLISALAIPLFFVAGILSKSTTITFVLLIPLTLIMICNYRFANIIIITTLLVIPATFFSRGYTIGQQILLFAAIYVAVAGLYILKNLRQISSSVISFLKELYTEAFWVNTNVNQPNTTPQLQYNTNVLKNYAVSIPFIVITLLAYVSAAVGIYGDFRILVAVSLVAVALLYSLSRKELHIFLITPVTLITIQLILFFHIKFPVVEALLIAFLAVQIASKHKWVRWVAIANFIIYAVVVALLTHRFFSLTIVVYIFLLNRRVWPVTIAIACLTAAYTIRKIVYIVNGTDPFQLNIISWPVIYLSIFMFWKQKDSLFTNIALWALPLITLFYFNTVNYKQNNSVIPNIKHAYIVVNNTQSIDPTPVQSVRPLKFMEYPLDSNATLNTKLGTSMVVLGHYLRLIAWPYPMSFYYGYAYIKATDLLTAWPLTVLIIHLLLLLISFFYINRNNLLALGILFYLASIAAFSGMALPIPGMMGDRFLLIPSLGYVFFIVGIAIMIFNIDFKAASLNFIGLAKPFKITLLVVLLVYSSVTIARNFDWKDRIKLFSKDITAVENSAQAQNLLALHLFLASNSATDYNTQMQMQLQAIPHFKQAIIIYPDFLNASYDLGRTYEAIANNFMAAKNSNMAAAYYDSAYKQYLKTVEIDTGFITPYYKMGLIAEQLADLYPSNASNYIAEAIPYYEKYITRFPQQKEVYANLSFAYYKLKEYDKSIDVNRRLLKEMPGAYEPIVNIGKTYLQMGVKDSAYYYFEKAYTIDNSNASLGKLVQDLKMELKIN